MLEATIYFATGRRVLIAFLAMVIVGFSLFSLGPYSEIAELNGNKPLPEERFSSVESTTGFLEAIGQEGRAMYGSFQLLDLLNPILICTFLILLLAWLLKLGSLTKRLFVLSIFPLLVLIGEFWENWLLYLAATGYPSIPGAMETHQIALYLKFGGLAVSVICAGVLACVAIFRKVRLRAKQ